MVPWRATEDGHVTPEVLEWYGRFAEGQPGVLVVEATGIRDVPSGPLLRIGSDRFVPGLRRLVETVRERSAGRTRLFIQVIDFVAVRRRPEPATFFARYLEIGDDLRRPPGRGARRRALAGRGRGPGCRGPGPPGRSRAPPRRGRAQRARAGIARLRLPRAGRRPPPAAHPRPAARPARALRRGRAAGARVGLRRRRASLRARVHDGLVPLPDEPADRRLRRGAPGTCAASAGGAPHGPEPGRRRLRGGHPLPGPRRRGGRQRRRRRGVVRAALRRGAGGLPVGVQGRPIRGRPAAQGRRGGLPVHRASRATSACPP